MDEHTGEQIPTDATSLEEAAERFVLDLIRQECPEWVENDGTCPKCLAYYESLDEITVCRATLIGGSNQPGIRPVLRPAISKSPQPVPGSHGESTA